jgi:hypothetical protein
MKNPNLKQSDMLTVKSMTIGNMKLFMVDDTLNSLLGHSFARTPFYRKCISPVWLIAFLATCLLLWCLNFHVVYGGNNDTVVVPKSTLTLSESFVSWNEIIDMPRLIVLMKHPLTMKALEDNGFIGH